MAEIEELYKSQCELVKVYKEVKGLTSKLEDLIVSNARLVSKINKDMNPKPDITLMITGDSGVGKSSFMNYIFRDSKGVVRRRGEYYVCRTKIQIPREEGVKDVIFDIIESNTTHKDIPFKVDGIIMMSDIFNPPANLEQIPPNSPPIIKVMADPRRRRLYTTDPIGNGRQSLTHIEKSIRLLLSKNLLETIVD